MHGTRAVIFKVKSAKLTCCDKFCRRLYKSFFFNLIISFNTSFFQSVWRLLLSLIKFSGVWLVLALACIVASAATLAWQLLWIKEWTDAYTKHEKVDSASWIRGLLAVCVADGTLFSFPKREPARAS